MEKLWLKAHFFLAWRASSLSKFNVSTSAIFLSCWINKISPSLVFTMRSKSRLSMISPETTDLRKGIFRVFSHQTPLCSSYSASVVSVTSSVVTSTGVASSATISSTTSSVAASAFQLRVLHIQKLT